MSKMKRIMMILGILTVSAAWLSAQDADSLWNQAVKDYTEENYQEALAGFTARLGAGAGAGSSRNAPSIQSDIWVVSSVSPRR